MKQLFAPLFLMLAIGSVQAQPNEDLGMEAPDANPAPVAMPVAPPVDIARDSINRINNPLGLLDVTTPEATVRSLVWALNKVDIKSMQECVSGALPLPQLSAVEEYLRRNGNSYWFLIADFHCYQAEKTATITLRLQDMRSIVNGGNSGSCERVHLVRNAGRWYILPGKNSEVFPVPGASEDALTALATLMSTTEKIDALQQQTHLSQCQSQLKQISLGIIQFLQDNHLKFNLNAGWQKQLQPYLRTDVLYHCPEMGADKLSYSLNPELENRDYEGLTWQATIMVYEGADKKFDFRHMNGTATNIAFADGHIKAFTKPELEEAMKNAQVIWK